MGRARLLLTPGAQRSTLPVAPLVAMLAWFLAACGPAPPDPVLDRVRLVTEGPAAGAAVAAALLAYGGYESWERLSSVEYNYTLSFYGGHPEPLRVTRQRQRLGLDEAVQVYIEDLDTPSPRIGILDGDAFSLTAGGVPVSDPSQAEFLETYARIVRWDFLLPWNLLDDGSRIESRGERTPQSAGPVPSGPCDVVRLRFERVTDGGGTDDWHDIYISRLSHLIEQVHSYRSAHNDYRLSVWSDHRNFGGIRVAMRRATYASDAAGVVGKLEALGEYEDVRFDAPVDPAAHRVQEAEAPVVEAQTEK